MDFNFENVGTNVASDLPEFSNNAIKEVYSGGFKNGGEKNKANSDSKSGQSGEVAGNPPSGFPDLEITGESNGKKSSNHSKDGESSSNHAEQSTDMVQEEQTTDIESNDPTEEGSSGGSASDSEPHSSRSNDSLNMDKNGNPRENHDRTGEAEGNAASKHSIERSKRQNSFSGIRSHGRYPQESIEQKMED